MKRKRTTSINALVVALTGLLLASGSSAALVDLSIASCTDETDGDLTSTVTWDSSRDGALGVGSPLPNVDLSYGMHTITVTCADAAGNAATESVDYQVADTMPPVIEGPITITPVTTGPEPVAVIPEAALDDSDPYGMRITPGSEHRAIVLYKNQDSEPEPQIEWGQRVEMEFLVRTAGATFEEGVEVVIVRGLDLDVLPIFDLILRGTAAPDAPEAYARVYANDMIGHVTAAAPLSNDIHKLRIAWRSDLSNGSIRLYVDDRDPLVVTGLDTLRTMDELRWGLPVSTVGFSGYLDIDETAVYGS